MLISKQLAADLKWLSETEEWSEEDKADAKRCLKGDPVFFSHFFTVFVRAKHAGYKYQMGGRYVRLATFCVEHGLPDPYSQQFTDAQVDGGKA